jgi:hypothetical protein
MTEKPKSKIPDSPFNEILRPRYKFVSSDKRYYILAFYITRLDGTSISDWSKYCYDNDGLEQESIISNLDDFKRMIHKEE